MLKTLNRHPHELGKAWNSKSRPVCATRYLCHPKGIKERYAATKEKGQGTAKEMNIVIQQRFQWVAES